MQADKDAGLLAIDDSRVEIVANGITAQLHRCAHVEEDTGRILCRTVRVDHLLILGTNLVQILGCLHQSAGGTMIAVCRVANYHQLESGLCCSTHRHPKIEPGDTDIILSVTSVQAQTCTRLRS